MRIFSLPRDHLRLLDIAVHGRLSDALIEIARNGGDPEIHAERPTSPNDRWALVVTGAGYRQRFEISKVVGLGVAAHIHLTDYTDELKADIARCLRDCKVSDEMDLEGQLPWPHRPNNGGLS